MVQKITGTFEVELTPGVVEGKDIAPFGLMTFDKTFSGPLTGTSKGTMFSAYTEVKGSAGYVAMEHVKGTLDGKKGSFMLQHSSTMSAAGQSQSIVVVPDSGTGDLKGISGSLMIRIEGGQHFYDFEYGFAK